MLSQITKIVPLIKLFPIPVPLGQGLDKDEDCDVGILLYYNMCVVFNLDSRSDVSTEHTDSNPAFPTPRAHCCGPTPHPCVTPVSAAGAQWTPFQLSGQ